MDNRICESCSLNDVCRPSEFGFAFECHMDKTFWIAFMKLRLALIDLGKALLDVTRKGETK